MTPRQLRLRIFEGTRDLCLTHPRLRDAITTSKAAQKIYWEVEPIPVPPPRFSQPASLVLSPRKTVEAAQPYAAAGKRVCILNFASSVAPGGGVVSGEQAQEESICRVSTLYFALSDPDTAMKFYDRHWELIRAGKMNRRNRDDIIYTPGIIAIRDDAAGEIMMEEENWYPMDVITCAAPDLRQSGDASQFTPSREELLQLHEVRWGKILAPAAAHKADVLILGAFGCGVFANPPELVAEAFNHAVEPFRHHFETIEFAVYTTRLDSANYRAFSHIRDIRER